MDPTTVCCPKPHCHARGPTGQGHIGIHSSGVFNVEIRHSMIPISAHFIDCNAFGRHPCLHFQNPPFPYVDPRRGARLFQERRAQARRQEL